MGDYQEKEWVKGPFANTVIEGFIKRVSHGSCDIIIKHIQKVDEPLPPHLTIGSVHTLPSRVIDDFFTVMKPEQQYSLINLAKHMHQEEWVLELVEQFQNPFDNDWSDETCDDVDLIYSDLVKQEVVLSRESKERLYNFYLEAIQQGMTSSVKTAEDIKDTESLDVVIASIVLVSKDKKGISYVQSLVKREDNS